MSRILESGAKGLRVLNIESGHPTVELALRRLELGLRTAKAAGEKQLKVVHGYGSSGSGGAIKAALPGYLARAKRSGLCRDFACGAEFSPFGEAGRRLVDVFPALARDIDYRRINDGITVILL